jgi:uncharacterized protein YbbC (DUF1343 family)
MSRVQTGLELLVQEMPRKIQGAKLGIVCHPASVDAELHHAIDLLQAAGAQVAAIFGPEHGARGEAQDMEDVDDIARDPKLGVPIHSLYGATFASLTPQREHLQDLDALVIDLQDVGARYYTFVWTMGLCLQAAGEIGLRVLVCDRPNPLNGLTTEGNLLKEPFRSFVGLHPLPNRHGLTPGEIAGYLQRYRGIQCDLEIIPLRGWQRAMYFDETGLPWVYPSPNMPTLDTAIVYPGLCLVEATELSEGRGTCRPFEVVGAPGIDPEAFAAALTAEQLPGCRFRPLYFRPQFQKHANAICGGVQIHVTDRDRFNACLTGVAVLRGARQVAPPAFAWRHQPYEFVEAIPAIDLLAGDDSLRLGLEAGAALADLSVHWAAERATFEDIRQAVFLYR